MVFVDCLPFSRFTSSRADGLFRFLGAFWVFLGLAYKSSRALYRLCYVSLEVLKG